MIPRMSLVTGGAGFLGRHLVTQLAARGDAVRVLDPAAAEARDWPQGVEPLPGSVLDAQVLTGAMAGVDTVYHMAANAHLWAPDPAVFRRINVEGLKAVLSAAKAAGVRRVVVASSAVILVGRGSRWTGRPITESDPRPPLQAMTGPYARSKWRAERLAWEAAAAGQDVVVTYPAVPVGAGDESLTPPTRMVMDFLTGRAPAYLESRMTLCGAADMARGHLLAAEYGRAGEGYILGGERLWLSELLHLLAEVSGRPMPTRRVPYGVAMTAAHVQEWIADHITHRPPQAPVAGVRLAGLPQWFDSGKAERDLGWHPAPLREALAEAVAWLRETGRV